MLQKLCDNCKKEIPVDSYDNGNFRIEINKSDDEVIEFSGDLCEECENKIIEEIKNIFKNYNLAEQNEDETLLLTTEMEN